MTNKKLKFLKNNDWKFCVKNSPIIAIDLILQNKNSEILMGQRINNPAKNFYFVPGGRIFKDEKINNAIERISNAELGKIYTIEDTYFMNYYEHFYHNSIWDLENITTHYVVLAFKINSNESDKFDLNSQHKNFEWVSKKNEKKLNIHQYSLEYLN